MLKSLENHTHNDLSRKIKKEVIKIITYKQTLKDFNQQQLKEYVKKHPDNLHRLAAVGQMSQLLLGLDPFPVQYAAALEIINEKIVEMKTGEGKTLVAVLAGTVLGLNKRQVQVVTVNEYLAHRDCTNMGPVYKAFGLSVSEINSKTEDKSKIYLYRSDIIYITNSEAGFNYLRDNQQYNPYYQSSRQDFAIVDEADSVLLDDARTPLIIAKNNDKLSALFRPADIFVKLLEPKDVKVDRERHSVALTQSGTIKADRFFKVKNIYDGQNKNIYFYLSRALYARFLLRRGYDYLVRGNKIVLLDASNGRIADGRRLSDGLHQAVEAKEGVKINPDNMTSASITYQGLFQLYKGFAGMTGTAYSARKEFKTIYHKKVVRIPTNRPNQVNYLPDRLFVNRQAKLMAMLKTVRQTHQRHQPILIGTNDVNKAHQISDFLNQNKLKNQLLTAEDDSLEAEIIANAGQLNMITVATNMAGRGTDIKLGKEVDKLGGLFIIVDGRSMSRRIDDQFAGRTGRQGEPGMVQFLNSFDDELMAIHLNRDARQAFEKETPADQMEITKPALIKKVNTAQRLWEGQNFDTRKNTIHYDQPVSRQREAFYSSRQHLLTAQNAEILKKFVGNVTSDQDKKLTNLKQKVYYINDKDWLKIRQILLNDMDQMWQDQLLTLDAIREESTYVQYQQQQPIVIYTRRAKTAYLNMILKIQHQFEETIQTYYQDQKAVVINA